VQASLVAEEVLREGGDAVRVVFNKFHSAISFKPTMATVLNAETLESQLAGEQGSKLDVYEMEVANERGDALQDLAEFNLAVVSRTWCPHASAHSAGLCCLRGTGYRTGFCSVFVC
jgi:F-type H+-transporting ATPase subunit gamma